MSRLIKIFAIGFSISLCFSCKGDDSKSQENPQIELNDTEQTEQGTTTVPEGKTASKNGLYLVSIEWSDELRAGTLENSAKVHFNDSTGEHVPAVLKSFKLYMVSMGHGSIKESEMSFTRIDDAHWQVNNIYFSMPGPAESWAADIEAEVNGQVDSARVSIRNEIF